MTTKKKTVKKGEDIEKKEEGVTPEQMQQSAAQAVQSYFTKEVNETIQELTNDRMFALLRQLEQSEYWWAILRYNNLRLLNSQSALNTLDPVVNPSAMSRQQGAMMGLCDLQNAIITMIAAEKAAAKEIGDIEESF